MRFFGHSNASAGGSMSRGRAWTSRTTVRARPEHVIDTLTDTGACARWSPVSFSLEGGDGERLRAGTTHRVSGRVLGAPVRFQLHTLAADVRTLRLHARGPVDIRVRYALTPAGSGCEVDARVSIHPSPTPLGRLIGRATGLMLTAGTLDDVLGRIAREAEWAARRGAAGQAA